MSQPGRPGEVAGAEDARRYPLAPLQEPFWWKFRSDPSFAGFNMAFAARITNALDVEAMRKAWSALTDRHPGLRTTFAGDAEGAKQVEHRHLEPLFRAIDATALGSNEVDRAVREEYLRPFDLGSSLPARLSVFRLAGGASILLMVVHHVIFDLGGADALLDELPKLYEGFVTGKSVELPALRATPEKYAVWHRALLASPAAEELKSYWIERLRGATTLLALPLDRPRKAQHVIEPAAFSFSIGRPLSENVRALAKSEDTSVYRTLLAAYEVVLARYTGQSDLLVAVATDTRPGPEYEGLVTNFVNTIPFRIDVSLDAPFRELLRQVKDRLAEDAAHKQYPVNLIVEAVNPERDPNRAPLFQTSFALHKKRRRPELSGNPMMGVPWRSKWGVLDLEPVQLNQGAYELHFTVVEWEGEFFIDVKYDASTHDEASIERLVRSFQTVLASAVSDPSQRVGDLALLDDAQKKQILVFSTGPDSAVPGKTRSRTLHEGFEAVVKRAPESTAIVSRNETLTYRELDARASRVAAHLAATGVQAGDRVGVLFDRSASAVVATLGALKAGAAYVPLDPNYPRDRVKYIVENSAIGVIVSDRATLTRLDATANVKRVALEDVPQEGALSRTVDPESLAYVIYTSGSTGQPKGVMVTQRAATAAAYTLADPRVNDLDDRSRNLWVTSFSFDASVYSIFATLLAGAAVHVAANEALGRDLWKVLRDQKITHIVLPPSVWASLPAEPLPDLRVAVATGEACPIEIVRRWAAGCRFVNGYGPTENTVGCTTFVCNAKDETPPPIGRPIPGTTAYVLDARRNLAPLGAFGELYVGGEQLASGYLGRLDQTAERFVPDSVSGASDRKLYRTGDLARFRNDGNLEFLGRVDRQVKIRGFRIELDEVQSVLGAIPGVVEAAVNAVPTAAGKALVGYVVGSRTEAELRAMLKERLPPFMVPSQIVVLENFPRTPNGKIDFEALPLPKEPERPAAAEAPAAGAAPRTLEQIVADVWKSVLKVDQVGLHDSFFDLGGHSLLALEVVHELASATGQTIPVGAVFDAPTVAALAEHLRAKQETILSTLKPGTRERAVYMFHPSGGEIAIYRKLAQSLNGPWPVIGVRSRAQNGEEPEFEDLDQMGKHYANVLATRQPEGDFLLLGWSMGGGVAFSTAHHLEELGRNVKMLALINAHIISPADLAVRYPDRADIFLVAPELGPLSAIFHALDAEKRTELAGQLMALPSGQRLAAAASYARDKKLLGADLPLEIFQRQAELYQHHYRAMDVYAAPTIRADLHLWWAEQSLVGGRKPATNWEKSTTGKTTSDVLPGDHYSIMQSALVKNLADQLAKLLADLGET